MTMKGSNMNLAFGLEVIYEDAEFQVNDHDKVGIVGVKWLRENHIVPCSAAGAGIRQRKY